MRPKRIIKAAGLTAGELVRLETLDDHFRCDRVTAGVECGEVADLIVHVLVCPRGCGGDAHIEVWCFSCLALRLDELKRSKLDADRCLRCCTVVARPPSDSITNWEPIRRLPEAEGRRGS